MADGANDVQPLWTRDGTRLLFEQKVQGEAGRGYVELVNADGGGLRRITPEPMTDLRWYELAPDGKSVLILSNIDGAQRISVANADGTGVRPLGTGSAVQEVEFLPPDGAQLLYVSFGGVYRMNLDGTGQTTIVKPVSLFNHEDEVFMMGIAVPSPDGTSIAYSSIEGLKVRVHVVNADGTGDRVVGHDPNAWGEWSPLWSPDGSRLLLDRVIGPPGDWSVPAKPKIVTIDGSAPDVTVLALPEGASDEYRVWAPDGRTILVRPAGEPTAPNRQVLWDASTGASTATPWSATSYPAMQRLAP